MALRLISVCIAIIAFSGVALGEKAEKSSSENIGPWEIEVTYKADKFDRCTISRKADEIVARFVRTKDGLKLILESAKWELEPGEDYPVRMRAGPSVWDTKVAAEANSVSVVISDKGFVQGLSRGNMLKVEGAGSTIRIPLNGSRLALDRLEKCFEKNSHALESNPFVKPEPGP
jgi:hypothetical protein